MALENRERELLMKVFRNDCSEDDRERIKRIFCDPSKDDDLKQFLKKNWYAFLDEEGKVKDLDHILYRVHYKINSDPGISRNENLFIRIVKWSSRIAAVIMLPLLIYLLIHYYRPSESMEPTWIEINAPAWTHVKFSLPDGSEGWLNSKSSVRYKSDFARSRKLYLNGEACFDVRKDTEHPFSVGAGDISVTVSGTKFNIASYEDENNIEVVLEDGELVVENLKKNQSVTMKPNDLVIFSKVEKNFQKQVVQPQKYLAWTVGRLEFRNDPIDVIARRLGRWYNADIEIIGNNSEDVRLRATFIDENLEEVLYFLSRSLPIDYKIINAGYSAAEDAYTKKKIVITIKSRQKVE